MPRSEWANEHIRDERRRDILQAAARQFAATGYAGTLVSDITQAAEVSKGLLYHYFDSKAALFSALVEQIADGVDRLIAEAETRRGTPLERIRWFIQQAFQGAEGHPAMFPVLILALAPEAQALPARDRVSALMERSGSAMARLIAEGQELGEIRAGDAGSFAHVLGACLEAHALGSGVGLPLVSLADTDAFVALLVRQ